MAYPMQLKKGNRYILHILFWLVIYIVYFTQYMYNERSDSARHQFSAYDRSLTVFFHLLAVIAASYFITIRVLPFLFDRKKIIRGIFELCIGIYAIAICSRLSVIYVLEPILDGNFGKQESIPQILGQFSILFKYYIISIVSGALPFIIFYLLIDRQRIMRMQVEIEKEKISARLDALKAQINPHFLFNTLNNIYSLAVQQSVETAPTIDRLSQLLDYLLYRCNDNYVSLDNEIQFLRNYLDLGKMRFGNRLSIQFSHETDRPYTIAPLLLVPVIENMFKHGAEQTTGPAVFSISLKADNNQLTLIAINNFMPGENKVPGIGLSNLKLRLDILFPGRYILRVVESNEIFEVKMQVPLV
jgi:two-component system, LytTR family, sensor kinase